MEDKKIIYKKLAAEYGISSAHIHAVASVESNGTGYLEDGRPKILFERHVFWKELKTRNKNPSDYLPEYANVLNSSGGGYGQGGANQHSRLAKAEELCRKIGISKAAALNSCSWGTFQIMGFNNDRAGYKTVEAMVEDFKTTKTPIYTNTKAMLNFCKSKNLIAALRAKDWHAFARGYNGAGYKQVYVDRLEKAYNEYVA